MFLFFFIETLRDSQKKPKSNIETFILLKENQNFLYREFLPFHFCRKRTFFQKHLLQGFRSHYQSTDPCCPLEYQHLKEQNTLDQVFIWGNFAAALN